MNVIKLEWQHVILGQILGELTEGPRPGTISGAHLSALVDITASMTALASRSTEDDAFNVVAVDGMLSYLAPATSDVTAEGRVLRAGRNLIFVDIVVRGADDRPVLVARYTESIIRGN